jgi:hypothetical protein
MDFFPWSGSRNCRRRIPRLSHPDSVPIPSVRSFCGTRRESTGGKGGTGAESRTVRILMNSRLCQSRFCYARSLDRPQTRVIFFRTSRRRQVLAGLWYGAGKPRDPPLTVLNVRIRPKWRISREQENCGYRLNGRHISRTNCSLPEWTEQDQFRQTQFLTGRKHLLSLRFDLKADTSVCG